MRKKNGFTLIELLVTIVLIISILGIAIVSIMKLSEKQKENEYNKVKEQVMNAAEQYFASNEYLFEGVEESGYGIITVDELVKNDYLNKVTNPLIGKPLNVCDQVKVTRNKNGKYKFTYLEASEYSSTVCSSNSLMIKTHENAPELEVSFNAEKGDDDWFNKKELNDEDIELGNTDKGLFVEIKTNAIDVKYCINENGVCDINSAINKLGSPLTDGEEDFYDKENFNNKDGSRKKYVCYFAINESGYIRRCLFAGVDEKAPTINLQTYASSNLEEIKNKTSTTSYDGNWYSGYVGVQATFSDNISTPTITYKRTNDPDLGGSSKKELTNSSGSIYDWSEANGRSYYEYSACDEAKNCSNLIQQIVKLDRVAPECNTASLSKNAASTGWYNISTGKPTLTLSATDSLSGINGSASNNPTITTGNNNYSYTFKDNAGNTKTCSKSVKYDNTAPVVNINITHRESDWYNTDLSYTVSASDDITDIGSLKGYWNASGIPTSNVNKSDNKWDTDHYKNGSSGTADLTKLANGVYSDGDNTKFSAQGHRKLRYIACDEAGNCATSSEKEFKIDKSAPSCNDARLSINPVYNGWYNSSSGAPTLTLSAADKFSGINGSTSNNPQITEGNKTYSYTFTDNVGYTVKCSYDIKYDKTPPVFNSIVKYNYPSSDDLKNEGYNAHILFDTFDNLSGVKEIKYRHCYNGGTKSSPSWYCGNTPLEDRDFGPALGNQVSPGKYALNLKLSSSVKFEFKLYDNAGNYTSHGPKDY